MRKSRKVFILRVGGKVRELAAKVDFTVLHKSVQLTFSCPSSCLHSSRFNRLHVTDTQYYTHFQCFLAHVYKIDTFPKAEVSWMDNLTFSYNSIVHKCIEACVGNSGQQCGI